MAYSSDKKFNKSGSSDKKRGSSEKFSRGKKEGDRPFKSRDSSVKPERKRFEGKEEGSESKDRPFKRTEERSSKSFSRRDSGGERKSSFGKPKRDGDFKKTYPKKDGPKGGKEGPYKKRDGDSEEKPRYDRTKRSSDGPKKPYPKKDGPYKKRDSDSEEKPRYDRTKRSSDGPKKPYPKKDGPYKKRDSERSDDGFKKPYVKREEGSEYKSDKRDFNKPSFDSKKKDDKREDGKPKFRKSKRSFEKNDNDTEHKSYKDNNDSENKYRGENSSHKKFIPKTDEKLIEKEFDGLVRLNKYLSNAGICSRREADELIKAGTVTVNGVVVTEMGYKVKSSDTINYAGARLKNERKVYILLNKPKDYITTTDDPRERHTVMELIADACKERVYPVGRLDRNTVGLLLFTNDGEMATKLMHPKFEIKKVYQVSLDKNIKPDDFEKLEAGIELEDGFIKPDEVSFITDSKREIGIEIHSGKNRIVRRMFEHLGYVVVKLDRVAYAGLTKKDLQRGRWRFLTPKEVSFLKMIG